jgi:hypothetical protein
MLQHHMEGLRKMVWGGDGECSEFPQSRISFSLSGPFNLAAIYTPPLVSAGGGATVKLRQHLKEELYCRVEAKNLIIKNRYWPFLVSHGKKNQINDCNVRVNTTQKFRPDICVALSHVKF